MRRLVAVVACSALGCSFFLSAPPDPPRPETAPTCDPTVAAPVVDSILSAGFLSGSVAALVESNRQAQCNECTPNFAGPLAGLGALLLIPAIVYAGAAANGFFKTHRCRCAIRAHDDFRRRQSRP